MYFSNGSFVPHRLVLTGFSRVGRKSDPITLQKYVDCPIKPDHLAPENWVGSPDPVAESSDVYSLGILLRLLWDSGVFEGQGGPPPAFIARMLAPRVADRLTLEAVIDYADSAAW